MIGSQLVQEAKSSRTTAHTSGSVEVVEVVLNDHILDMIDLAKAHHKEFDDPNVPFDEQVCMDHFIRVKNDLDRQDYTAYIAYVGAKPVGYALCSCSGFYYSKARQATLQYWFVLPEHRRSSVAFRLIKAYEQWARLRGAVKIWSSVAHERDAQMAEMVGRMFEKMKYKKVGSFHLLSLTRS